MPPFLYAAPPLYFLQWFVLAKKFPSLEPVSMPSPLLEGFWPHSAWLTSGDAMHTVLPMCNVPWNCIRRQPSCLTTQSKLGFQLLILRALFVFPHSIYHNLLHTYLISSVNCKLREGGDHVCHVNHCVSGLESMLGIVDPVE